MSVFSHVKKHFGRYKDATSPAGGASSSPVDIGSTVVLDHYAVSITKKLAEGGFGSVYIAEDDQHKQYALKKMLVLDQETLEATTREVEYMKRLPGHSNIVHLHASDVRPCGKHAEVLMLMEYCPGGHVVDIMNRRLKKPFTEPEVLKIFADVCLAVSALHMLEPPIIHRDIKLENVLLAANKGSFKLCDFGSATTQAIVPGETMPIALLEEEIGRYTTPQYRAPEMIDLYQHHTIDTRADAWALGCLLYKLMFFSDAFEDTTLSVLNGRYKVPEDTSFSPELLQLLSQLLVLDPTKRISSPAACKRCFELRGMECPLVIPASYLPDHHHHNHQHHRPHGQHARPHSKDKGSALSPPQRKRKTPSPLGATPSQSPPQQPADPFASTPARVPMGGVTAPATTTARATTAKPAQAQANSHHASSTSGRHQRSRGHVRSPSNPFACAELAGDESSSVGVVSVAATPPSQVTSPPTHAPLTAPPAAMGKRQAATPFGTPFHAPPPHTSHQAKKRGHLRSHSHSRGGLGSDSPSAHGKLSSTQALHTPPAGRHRRQLSNPFDAAFTPVAAAQRPLPHAHEGERGAATSTTSSTSNSNREGHATPSATSGKRQSCGAALNPFTPSTQGGTSAATACDPFAPTPARRKHHTTSLFANSQQGSANASALASDSSPFPTATDAPHSQHTPGTTSSKPSNTKSNSRGRARKRRHAGPHRPAVRHSAPPSSSPQPPPRLLSPSRSRGAANSSGGSGGNGGSGGKATGLFQRDDTNPFSSLVGAPAAGRSEGGAGHAEASLAVSGEKLFSSRSRASHAGSSDGGQHSEDHDHNMVGKGDALDDEDGQESFI